MRRHLARARAEELLLVVSGDLTMRLRDVGHDGAATRSIARALIRAREGSALAGR